MTVLISIGISATLLGMGYKTCTDGTFTCTQDFFPCISDVIITNEMYDRIFLLLTTVMMFGVQQVNIRAFYKKLYGIIPDSKNDFLLDLGIASCVALPLIGIFDEKNFLPMHITCAVIFFGCFAIYCILLSHHLSKNKASFPVGEQRAISIIFWVTWGIIGCGVFALITPFLGYRFWAPVAEWVTVLSFCNFFAVASYANSYYDSVHEYGTLIQKK